MNISMRIHLVSLLGLVALFSQSSPADVSVGEQIYQHCKVCHGLKGLGGEGGKYPRIAGLPQAYLEKQLADFKSRKRVNKPMIPVFKNWRFNTDAITAVAGYVTQLPMDDLEIPPAEPGEEILAMFDSPAEMLEVGEDLFQDCVQCHGERATGKADKKSPPLVNQYPKYLRKQIGDFAIGLRSHENADSLFAELEADEVEALLVYIGSLED